MTRIGASDLDVFPLVLGGNVFGWTADRGASFAILDAFVAGGGNLVDTAEGYSAWVNDGYESERIIGEWIAARKPSAVKVATKTGGHRDHRNLRPERVAAAADASLDRLGVEAIDLYWAHYDDPEVPVAEQVGAFGALVQAGKVRWLGLSNYTPARLREWVEEARRQGAPVPVAFQPHYNLVHRAVEADVVPLAAEFGISLLPYYALAAGFLTGKYRSERDLPETPRAANAGRYATPQGFAIVDALEEIGRAHGASIAAVALAWLRAQPTVAAPIASASRAEQVPDLLASATITLTPAELAELDTISKRS